MEYKNQTLSQQLGVYSKTYNDIEPRLSHEYLWTMMILYTIYLIYLIKIVYQYNGSLTRISKLVIMSCLLGLTCINASIITAKFLVGNQEKS